MVIKTGFDLLDEITGSVDGLAPGDDGYLTAALARSEASGLLLQPDQLPAHGGEVRFEALPLNPNRNDGLLLLVDGDRNRIFSSFAAANPGSAARMISLGNSANGLVLGFEDQSAALGPSDIDYNDVIVKISNVMVPLL